MSAAPVKTEGGKKKLKRPEKGGTVQSWTEEDQRKRHW